MDAERERRYRGAVVTCWGRDPRAARERPDYSTDPTRMSGRQLRQRVDECCDRAHRRVAGRELLLSSDEPTDARALCRDGVQAQILDAPPGGAQPSGSWPWSLVTHTSRRRPARADDIV